MTDQSNKPPAEQYRFNVRVSDNDLAPFTFMRLFNGFNEIIKEGYGNINVEVPRGLYQLNIEMNEFVDERKYRVTGEVNDLVDIKTQSAIPLNGFTTTHEYFQGPASYWSRYSTITNNNIAGTSMFLFFRYSDKNKPYKKITHLQKNFIIVNSNRDIIFTLDQANTKTDSGHHEEWFGSVCFHEMVEPGQYYLIYVGKQKREIPLYLFKDWQTQVFIMFNEEPIFGSTRISIERQGFNWDSPQNIQLDSLIQKMYNGIYHLPNELKEAAAHGKWNNPMLGILASYIYLLSDDTLDDRLFNTIITNLQNEILHSDNAPDIIAIKLIRSIHFKLPVPDQPLEHPCMIAAGMYHFLEQSFKNDKLISSNSIADKVFANFKGDSIWSSYKPLPYNKPKQKNITRSKSIQRTMSSDDDSFAVESRFKPEKDWITASIFSYLAETKTGADINQLASQLSITSNNVKTSLKKLNSPSKLNAVATAIFNEREVSEKLDNIESISSRINEMLNKNLLE